MSAADYFTQTALVAQTLARASAVNTNLSAIEAGFGRLPDRAITDTGRVTFCLTAGAADVYTVTMHKTPAAYYNGMSLIIEVHATNTGACTINVDSLGAKAIKIMNGTEPAAGDLTAGDFLSLTYDSDSGFFVITSVVRSVINGQASMSDDDILDAIRRATDPGTLSHTTGTISIDCSTSETFSFEADTYTPSSVTFVASKNITSTGVTALPATAQEGDYVLVFIAYNPAGTSNVNGGYSTAGFVLVGSTAAMACYYKKMGATPDTTVDVSSMTTGNATIVILRGCDGTTLEDTAEIDASNASSSTPDPASITTVTDGAMVIAAIACSNDISGSGMPAGYTEIENVFSGKSNVTMYKSIATAGAEDPGGYGSATTNWAATTYAFRPGVGSGTKDYTVSVSNVPAAGLYRMRLFLELKTTLGAWTWPAGWEWAGGSAPAMNTVKVHEIVVTYIDGANPRAEYIGAYDA